MTFGLASLAKHYGYVALAGLVGAESTGLPVPGETALITAGVLAREGHLDITLVIAIAASAAIAGDNIGYVIGRKGGRALLEKPGPLQRYRRKVLERGEPFFRRHGGKAVFLGRWFAGLRIAAAWLAGINRMPWPGFLFWNALGGVAWATAVGLAAYLLGPVAERVFKGIGVAGVGLLAVTVCAILVWRRFRTTREGRSD